MNDFFLGVDLGGSVVKIAIAQKGQLLANAVIQPKPRRGLQILLADLAMQLERLGESAGLEPGKARGIGIGFPGIIDPRSGLIVSTLDKYPDAPEIDLSAWALERWGLELRIENDAHAALLGEVNAGAARNCSDVTMMTLGTGVGTAAMQGGRLIKGHHGRGSCLGGHVTVNLHGPLCVCGNRGCVEAEASTWALKRLIADFDPARQSRLSNVDSVRFQQIFSADYDRDPLAIRVREHCLNVWSAAAVSLLHAYDPELLVIGGGVSRAGEQILRPMRQYIEQHAWGRGADVRLAPAMHPEYAALLGVERFPFTAGDRV